MTHKTTATRSTHPKKFNVQLYIIWITDPTTCPTFLQKVTAKLFLSLDNGHHVKSYEGVEAKLRVFLV